MRDPFREMLVERGSDRKVAYPMNEGLFHGERLTSNVHQVPFEFIPYDIDSNGTYQMHSGTVTDHVRRRHCRDLKCTNKPLRISYYDFSHGGLKKVFIGKDIT